MNHGYIICLIVVAFYIEEVLGVQHKGDPDNIQNECRLN